MFMDSLFLQSSLEESVAIFKGEENPMVRKLLKDMRGFKFFDFERSKDLDSDRIKLIKELPELSEAEFKLCFKNESSSIS